MANMKITIGRNSPSLFISLYPYVNCAPAAHPDDDQGSCLGLSKEQRLAATDGGLHRQHK
jgi:hypothetical protein